MATYSYQHPPRLAPSTASTLTLHVGLGDSDDYLDRGIVVGLDPHSSSSDSSGESSSNANGSGSSGSGSSDDMSPKARRSSQQFPMEIDVQIEVCGSSPQTTQPQPPPPPPPANLAQPEEECDNNNSTTTPKTTTTESEGDPESVGGTEVEAEVVEYSGPFNFVTEVNEKGVITRIEAKDFILPDPIPSSDNHAYEETNNNNTSAKNQCDSSSPSSKKEISTPKSTSQPQRSRRDRRDKHGQRRRKRDRKDKGLPKLTDSLNTHVQDTRTVPPLIISTKDMKIKKVKRKSSTPSKKPQEVRRVEDILPKKTTSPSKAMNGDNGPTVPIPVEEPLTVGSNARGLQVWREGKFVEEPFDSSKRRRTIRYPSCFGDGYDESDAWISDNEDDDHGPPSKRKKRAASSRRRSDGCGIAQKSRRKSSSCSYHYTQRRPQRQDSNVPLSSESQPKYCSNSMNSANAATTLSEDEPPFLQPEGVFLSTPSRTPCGHGNESSSSPPELSPAVAPSPSPQTTTATTTPTTYPVTLATALKAKSETLHLRRVEAMKRRQMRRMSCNLSMPLQSDIILEDDEDEDSDDNDIFTTTGWSHPDPNRPRFYTCVKWKLNDPNQPKVLEKSTSLLFSSEEDEEMDRCFKRAPPVVRASSYSNYSDEGEYEDEEDAGSEDMQTLWNIDEQRVVVPPPGSRSPMRGLKRSAPTPARENVCDDVEGEDSLDHLDFAQVTAKFCAALEAIPREMLVSTSTSHTWSSSPPAMRWMKGKTDVKDASSVDAEKTVSSGKDLTQEEGGFSDVDEIVEIGRIVNEARVNDETPKNLEEELDEILWDDDHKEGKGGEEEDVIYIEGDDEPAVVQMEEYWCATPGPIVYHDISPMAVDINEQFYPTDDEEEDEKMEEGGSDKEQTTIPVEDKEFKEEEEFPYQTAESDDDVVFIENDDDESDDDVIVLSPPPPLPSVEKETITLTSEEKDPSTSKKTYHVETLSDDDDDEEEAGRITASPIKSLSLERSPSVPSLQLSSPPVSPLCEDEGSRQGNKDEEEDTQYLQRELDLSSSSSSEDEDEDEVNDNEVGVVSPPTQNNDKRIDDVEKENDMPSSPMGQEEQFNSSTEEGDVATTLETMLGQLETIVNSEKGICEDDIPHLPTPASSPNNANDDPEPIVDTSKEQEDQQQATTSEIEVDETLEEMSQEDKETTPMDENLGQLSPQAPCDDEDNLPPPRDLQGQVEDIQTDQLRSSFSSPDITDVANEVEVEMRSRSTASSSAASRATTPYDPADLVKSQGDKVSEDVSSDPSPPPLQPEEHQHGTLYLPPEDHHHDYQDEDIRLDEEAEGENSNSDPLRDIASALSNAEDDLNETNHTPTTTPEEGILADVNLYQAMARRGSEDLQTLPTVASLLLTRGAEEDDLDAAAAALIVHSDDEVGKEAVVDVDENAALNEIGMIQDKPDLVEEDHNPSSVESEQSSPIALVNKQPTSTTVTNLNFNQSSSSLFNSIMRTSSSCQNEGGENVIVSMSTSTTSLTPDTSTISTPAQYHIQDLLRSTTANAMAPPPPVGEKGAVEIGSQVDQYLINMLDENDTTITPIPPTPPSNHYTRQGPASSYQPSAHIQAMYRHNMGMSMAPAARSLMNMSYNHHHAHQQQHYNHSAQQPQHHRSNGSGYIGSQASSSSYSNSYAQQVPRPMPPFANGHHGHQQAQPNLGHHGGGMMNGSYGNNGSTASGGPFINTLLERNPHHQLMMSGEKRYIPPPPSTNTNILSSSSATRYPPNPNPIIQSVEKTFEQQQTLTFHSAPATTSSSSGQPATTEATKAPLSFAAKLRRQALEVTEVGRPRGLSTSSAKQSNSSTNNNVSIFPIPANKQVTPEGGNKDHESGPEPPTPSVNSFQQMYSAPSSKTPQSSTPSNYPPTTNANMSSHLYSLSYLTDNPYSGPFDTLAAPSSAVPVPNPSPRPSVITPNPSARLNNSSSPGGGDPTYTTLSTRRTMRLTPLHQVQNARGQGYFYHPSAGGGSDHLAAYNYYHANNSRGAIHPNWNGQGGMIYDARTGGHVIPQQQQQAHYTYPTSRSGMRPAPYPPTASRHYDASNGYPGYPSTHQPYHQNNSRATVYAPTTSQMSYGGGDSSSSSRSKQLLLGMLENGKAPYPVTPAESEWTNGGQPTQQSSGQWPSFLGMYPNPQ